jgi:hypothetical protein
MELEATNQIEYQSLISSLISYTLTKHDMSFSINCMTRCGCSLQKPHSQVVMSILKHIQGTKKIWNIFLQG